jgi:nicotinamide mononucleotide adenylyltransferase
MSANLFIGRFQPPHKGHQSIFNTYLNQDEKILIAIRDVPTDEKNPFSAQQVMYLWKEIYRDNPNVEVIVIPDIKSVNYGRDVGYSINEIVAPSNIRRISATEIRSQILSGSEDWKNSVDTSIHEALVEMYAKYN